MAQPLLDIRSLTVGFTLHEELVQCVEGIDLTVEAGELFALIGESGCGKSTLTSAILGIGAPNTVIGPGSRILFQGENLLDLSPEGLRRFRWKRASCVFQAAQNALNPVLTLEEQFLDALWDHGCSQGRAADSRLLEGLLSKVRLEADRVLPAYPHELSGGMRQRAIIALALVLDPEFIVLDEPTTALDTITQHYVFDILRDVQAETGAAMLLVTHDLAAAAKLAGRVGVMYAGKLVEVGPAEEIFHRALHPYAAGLVDAQPSIEGDLGRHKAIPGAMPDLQSRPEGCRFHPRCPHAFDRCAVEEPPLEEVAPGHSKACFWNPDEDREGTAA